MLERLTRDSRASLTLAQDEAIRSDEDIVRSDHLLVGVLAQELDGISEVLRDAGVSFADVRCLVGQARNTGAAKASGTNIRLSHDCQTILTRAGAEASAMEHVYVEPGHLLLAMAKEKQAQACRVLLASGADLRLMEIQLLKTLPTRSPDPQRLQRSAESFSPLTTTQVHGLLRDIVLWKTAVTRLRTEGAVLTSSERTLLERECERTGGAWLKLCKQYLRLACSMAAQCAEEGHDIEYASMVARQALGAACLATQAAEMEEFETRAISRITAALERELGRSIGRRSHQRESGD